jgi:hypothetical protein
MVTELTNVSFTIFATKNGANQRDALTFLPSQRFSRLNELFECDEGNEWGHRQR